jgi:hypothetical protein
VTCSPVTARNSITVEKTTWDEAIEEHHSARAEGTPSWHAGQEVVDELTPAWDLKIIRARRSRLSAIIDEGRMPWGRHRTSEDVLPKCATTELTHRTDDHLSTPHLACPPPPRWQEKRGETTDLWGSA